MRVRGTLTSWGVIDLWIGLALVLAPFTAHRSLFSVILSFSYGGGFLLAALLSLVAWIVWSEEMQRRYSERLIRRLRIGAQSISFSMMLALLVVEVVVGFVAGWTLQSVQGLGLVLALVIAQASSLSDGDLTPVREALIWGKQGGKKRWIPRWLRSSRP